MAYTGPISRSRTDNETFWISQSIYKSKDKKQRSKNLPYSSSRYFVKGNWNKVNLENLTSVAAQEVEIFYPKVFDKFWAKTGAKASLMLTASDFPKSLEMIAKRAKQLTAAVSALRKGRVNDFVKALGIKDHPKNTSRKRKLLRSGVEPANTWLEFTFGWTPLVQDIGSAIEVLQQQFNPEPVHASSKVVRYPIKPFDGGSGYVVVTQCHYFVSSKIRVSNPNLFLANQLGFTNPAQVAWDIVPFSFVVDWFLPVNKFLGSFSNDLGLELIDPMRGWGVVTDGTFRHVSNYGGLPQRGRGVACLRTLGAPPRPSLMNRLRAPVANPWLAATSVSLLIQQLQKLR